MGHRSPQVDRGASDGRGLRRGRATRRARAGHRGGSGAGRGADRTARPVAPRRHSMRTQSALQARRDSEFAPVAQLSTARPPPPPRWGVGRAGRRRAVKPARGCRGGRRIRRPAGQAARTPWSVGSPAAPGGRQAVANGRAGARVIGSTGRLSAYGVS